MSCVVLPGLRRMLKRPERPERKAKAKPKAKAQEKKPPPVPGLQWLAGEEAPDSSQRSN